MPNERIIPSSQPKSVVTYTILSDDREISRTYNLLSVTINKEVNRIPSAVMVFNDGEPSKQTFEISNKEDFQPGKAIEIKTGYRSDEVSIFKGIVIRNSIRSRKKNSQLIVECRNKAVKMTVNPKNHYFKDSKDSEIIEELIDKYGIQNDVEATNFTQKEVVQYNSTDWDFMLCRTDMSGFICFAEDDQIKIGKPDLSQSEVLTIQFGATVHELDAEIDSRLQFKGVKAASWNPSSQELISGIEAADPSIPEAGNLSPDVLSQVIGEDDFELIHSGNLSEPELQSWADAKLLKYRLAKIRGTVKIDGTADVKPGDIIVINGTGERFEGKHFVSGVRHEIQKGNWQTILQFGLNPKWFAEFYDIEQPQAGAMLPPVSGLQIGVVTALEGDPDGEERIRVRVPVISNEDDGIWSRIATLDAGNNRGTVFRPEIGDEVIVGFINNDPRYAVVLGMCHSSANPSPIPASDDNNEKGYQSRSEMKMIYNDDKKTINLETPAGNKFLISEDEKMIRLEDQNGNKITLNQDGIKIESMKMIQLKAVTDVKIDSVNANVKSSGQLKMEGSGTAEFSSGGSTTVKGSIVQIN